MNGNFQPQNTFEGYMKGAFEGMVDKLEILRKDFKAHLKRELFIWVSIGAVFIAGLGTLGYGIYRFGRVDEAVSHLKESAIPTTRVEHYVTKFERPPTIMENK